MPDQDPQAPSYQDVANSGAPDIQGSNLSQALNAPEPQPTDSTQAPQGAVPGTVPDQSPQPMPGLAAPAPNLPRFQRTVGSTLKGMLLGLAMDGLPGAVAGAASPTAVQGAADDIKQETQARIKFANAQAASMVSDAAINDAKLHALPQQLQDQHTDLSLSFIKQLQDLGITPTLQAPNSGADATGALQQLTSSHGAVPPLFTVNIGHTVLAYDLSQLSGTPKGLDLVNRVRAIQGQSAIDSGMWRQTPVGARTETMNNAMQFFNPAAPKTAGDAFSQYQQYKNYADTYAKRKDVPNSGYDPAEADRLKTLVENLKTISDNFDTHEKSLKADEASQSARARTQAEGKDVEAMYKTGINPITKEHLDINNAPDEFLIDSRTGKPIPQNMVTALKPTQTELNRADFANSVIHSLDKIVELQNAKKLPNGPVSGLSAQGLAKAGVGTKDAQEALNYISLIQSAATGAHVGGRFSLPVLNKMQGLIGLNMNDSQFAGAVASIRDVMDQYVKNGGRMTVGEYKQSGSPQSGSAQTSGTKPATSNSSAVSDLIKKHAGGQ